MASSRFRRGLACLGAVIVLAGCAQLNYASFASHQVPGAAVTVHVVDSPETVGVYQPSIARVQPGQKVAWVNASGNYHTVTFNDPSLPSSPGLGPGTTYEATFTRPGTYRYRCIYHPGMVGEVVVGGQAASGPRTG